jgi:pSer/pThr/pTyr-binding forkhead associated (FHA) protein
MRRRDPPEPTTTDVTLVDTDPHTFSYSAALGRKALLVILSRDRFGDTFIIDKAKNVLGRQKECEFVIDDPLLSRQHCLFTIDDKGDFFIEDLNSTNETLLNSRPLRKKSQLTYGDRIVAGTTILRFYLEEELEKK